LTLFFNLQAGSLLKIGFITGDDGAAADSTQSPLFAHIRPHHRAGEVAILGFFERRRAESHSGASISSRPG